MTKICLNMIVKNESKIITSAFDNIRNNINIDLFIISDTGSTDNTIEVMQDYFKLHNLNYEIHSDEWINFEHNRNFALQHCLNKSDYILFFDADDRFINQIPLPSKLTADVYALKYKSAQNSNFFHFKNGLVKNNIGYWISVIHESFIVTQTEYSKINVEGDYYIQTGHFGNRSNDPNKYLNDAVLLEKAYLEQPDTSFLKARYAYYCATSYYSHGNKYEAIEWFKKRIELNDITFDFNEEYLAYKNLGMVYKELNDDANAINTWLCGWNAHPNKAELLYEISLLYSERKKNLLAYKIALWGEILCETPINTKYCYEENVYSYGLNYQISKYGLLYNFYTESLRALIRITTKPFFSKELVDHVIESLLLLAQKNTLDHISNEITEHLVYYVKSNECTKVFIRDELIEKLIFLKRNSKPTT